MVYMDLFHLMLARFRPDSGTLPADPSQVFRFEPMVMRARKLCRGLNAEGFGSKDEIS